MHPSDGGWEMDTRSSRVRLAVIGTLLVVSGSCGDPEADPPPLELQLEAVLVGPEPTRQAVQARRPSYPVYRLTGRSQARETAVWLEQGQSVAVRAFGAIHFAPSEDKGISPDGETGAAPDGYPAPGLQMNSLICRIGESPIQCGSTAEIVAPNSGLLSFQVNARASELTGGWAVEVRDPSQEGIPAFPTYQVLPTPSFRVDLRGSWAADMTVTYGPDRQLDELTPGKLPEATAAGWWSADLPSDQPGLWRISISPPLHEREASTIVTFRLSSGGASGTRVVVPISGPQVTGSVVIKGVYEDSLFLPVCGRDPAPIMFSGGPKYEVQTGPTPPQDAVVVNSPNYQGPQPPPNDLLRLNYTDVSGGRDIEFKTGPSHSWAYGMGVPGKIAGVGERYGSRPPYCPPVVALTLEWAAPP